MKILLPIKRVIDPYVKIRVKPDNSGVETANMKMAMNPFDEIAVEEAIRIQEAGLATEIIAVSIGPKSCSETIRHALALGADRGIHIETDELIEPLNIAKILQQLVLEEGVDLILMGKQSIDGDHNQTPQMLAARLDWPQATYAYSLDWQSDQSVIVKREIDGGLETVKLTLPAVISTDLRLNEPRFAALPNIMKAKRKPIDVRALDDMNLALGEHIKVLSVTEPPKREAGIRVESVDELMQKLVSEAKVI